LCRHPLKIYRPPSGTASLRLWDALFKGEVCGALRPLIEILLARCRHRKSSYR
jgi:hypothetical protein